MQGSYKKEYIGSATSENDAVQQARTIFRARPDYHVVAVEVVDREAWVEDALLPQAGDEGMDL